MGWFAFLFIAFIIFSSFSDASKKKKKGQYRALKQNRSSSQDAPVSPWDEPAASPETTYKVRPQALKTARARTAKRKAQVSRQLALKKGRKRSWTKSNFGQDTVAVDKNKARAQGFENGRARTLLDGKRVFGLVALSTLAIYIVGQV